MTKQISLKAVQYEERIYFIKRVAAVCAILLCFIDLICGSAYGGVQMIARNLTGAVISLLFFTSLKKSDFKHRILWVSALGYSILAAIVFFLLAAKQKENSVLIIYYYQWITSAFNFYLCGLITLFTGLKMFPNRKYPKIDWLPFGRWCILMIGMIFSKNDSLWPIWFFFLFGCFYLVDFNKDEMDSLFEGLLNGIIISFFLFQGYSILFRMLDSTRYTALYSNSNMNALFYLMVQCALLGKWFRLEQKNAPGISSLLCCVGSGCLLVFEFMTFGRTALVAMILLILFTLLFFLMRSKKQSFIRYCSYAVCIGFSTLLFFPILLFGVRYLPAAVNSPQIVSGDPMDKKILYPTENSDERFMKIIDFFKGGTDRLLWFQENGDEEETENTDEVSLRILPNMYDLVFPPLKAYAASGKKQEETTKNILGLGINRTDPVFSDKQLKHNPVYQRLGIYYGFLKQLNFEGHTNAQNGVWVTRSDFIGHAHNVFLQMLYFHGIITGSIFVVDAFAFLFLLICKLFRDKNDFIGYTALLFVFTFLFFGQFEMDWSLGQLSFFMYFLSKYKVMKE